MLSFDRELARSLAGEYLCTFIFIFTICSSSLNEGRLGGGISSLPGALCTSFVALSIIYSFGSISGAHFNPAVTFGAIIGRKIDPIKGVLYILLQVIAATTAIATLMGIFPEGGNIADSLVLKPGAGVSLMQALTIETIMSFILVFVIYATAMGITIPTAGGDASDEFAEEATERILQAKQRLPFGPLAIGFTLGFLCLIGGTISGGAFNPARATGPALLSLKFEYLWVYWAGDLLGAAIATGFYLALFAN